jgi:hypothetical protein
VKIWFLYYALMFVTSTLVFWALPGLIDVLRPSVLALALGVAFMLGWAKHDEEVR